MPRPTLLTSYFCSGSLVLCLLASCSSGENSNSDVDSRQPAVKDRTVVKIQEEPREKRASSMKDFNFLRSVIPLKNPDKYVTPPTNEDEKKALKVCAQVKTLAEKGDWDEALSLVRKACIECPDYPPLWNAKGVIYNEQKLLDSAMKSYEKAALLDPRYFTAGPIWAASMPGGGSLPSLNRSSTI